MCYLRIGCLAQRPNTCRTTPMQCGARAQKSAQEHVCDIIRNYTNDSGHVLRHIFRHSHMLPIHAAKYYRKSTLPFTDDQQRVRVPVRPRRPIEKYLYTYCPPKYKDGRVGGAERARCGAAAAAAAAT